MNLKQLKTRVKARLDDLVGDFMGVYDGKAGDNATFPYLVFKFPNASNPARKQTHRRMEIDFWNNSNDDSDLLDAADIIRNGKYVDEVLTVAGLDHSYQTETEGFYSCYWEFEGEIPDLETEISRIQQRYVFKID